MKYQFFAISALNPEPNTNLLNGFLASHRIVEVIRDFVSDGGKSFWAICVVYTDDNPPLPKTNRSAKVDYKEVLNPNDFALYAELREWRKQVAAEDGIPVYNVFSNEHLAAIVLQRVTTANQLQGIEGIGSARLERYFSRLQPLLLKFWGVK